MRSSLCVPTLTVSSLIKRVPRNKIEDCRSGLFGACLGSVLVFVGFMRRKEGDGREGVEGDLGKVGE